MTGRYSIWLRPDPETHAYRRLDEVIGEFADSIADAPDFDPHVTVLGGIAADRETVEKRTRDLAHGRDPFTLSFTSVSCSTTTHQCVFVLVEPSVELLELHRNAVEFFDAEAEMYVPHLSLVYSDMGLEERVRTMRSIDDESLPSEIRIETVAVVETSGPVQTWETTGTYSL